MAEYKKNFFTIEGTIYSKPSRIVKAKKDNKEYEFKSIILELKRVHKGKTFIDLPEFQLGYGVDDNGFDIGDHVQVSFALVGKEISESFHKTELKALYIKHPDLQQGNDSRDVGGEAYPKKAKKEVTMSSDLEFNDDDLPF